MTQQSEAGFRMPDGSWPIARSAILDWLVRETQGERFLDNLFVGFCGRLNDAGMQIARATMHLQILHPLWFGARVLWRPGMEDADLQTYAHGGMNEEAFLNSPMKVIYDGASEVRQRLERPEEGRQFPICEELALEGLTDYIAWPLTFTLGKRHIISIATDRHGGFLEEELSRVRDLLLVLAPVCEIRLKNRLARTLLETYVGPHASDQILNGSITRGSGVTVKAVVSVCDLRGFTAISELWPRDDVIMMLNAYFDAMSAPVQRHGGEILKFIGDGMLAIFPLENPSACANALKAATESRDSMASMNRDRLSQGLEPLGYGIGVHMGDVMYGNIGSSTRLDFTVIGPAVNTAARLEGLTKLVGRKVLFSNAFVEALGSGDGLDEIGSFPLRGMGAPIGVFALADAASTFRDTRLTG